MMSFQDIGRGPVMTNVALSVVPMRFSPPELFFRYNTFFHRGACPTDLWCKAQQHLHYDDNRACPSRSACIALHRMSLMSPAPRRLLFPLPRCDADAIASAKTYFCISQCQFPSSFQENVCIVPLSVETYSKTLGVVCCTAVLLSFDGLAGGLFPYPKRGGRALATTK